MRIDTSRRNIPLVVIRYESISKYHIYPEQSLTCTGTDSHFCVGTLTQDCPSTCKAQKIANLANEQYFSKENCKSVKLTKSLHLNRDRDTLFGRNILKLNGRTWNFTRFHPVLIYMKTLKCNTTWQIFLLPESRLTIRHSTSFIVLHSCLHHGGMNLL